MNLLKVWYDAINIIKPWDYNEQSNYFYNYEKEKKRKAHAFQVTVRINADLSLSLNSRK